MFIQTVLGLLNFFLASFLGDGLDDMNLICLGGERRDSRRGRKRRCEGQRQGCQKDRRQEEAQERGTSYSTVFL